MYQISVGQTFDAAHFLRGSQGKCEEMHGHSFRAVAKITATQVNEIGLAYDFTKLKHHLADILSRFDHTCLNDIPPFNEINPSSENIATTIYNELQPRLTNDPVSLWCVEVWESPTTGVAYTPD